MRIAVLMALGIPWSREAVCRLADFDNEMHVIDFSSGTSDTYLDRKDPIQAAEIRAFATFTFQVHQLQSVLTSQVRYVLAARKLAKILREIQPDFLLTLYGGGFGLAAYLSGFRPYGVYVVGTDVLFGSQGKRLLSRIALTKASVVFANGIHLAQKARQLAPHAEVRPLYLGTDTVKLCPAKPPEEPVRIVCTRGFCEIYNNDYLVRALAEMPPIEQAYETIFAATGPLLQKIIALADRILRPDQRKNVSFIGGTGREELAALLRSSHIFVSTSRSDGTSLSLMEGLACGLFPVLSDIPANREWIFAEAENGFLVPLDNPKALADALVCSIQNREMRSRAAPYNRRLILDRADDRKTMKILSSEIHSIVREQARGRLGRVERMDNLPGLQLGSEGKTPLVTSKNNSRDPDAQST